MAAPKGWNSPGINSAASVSINHRYTDPQFEKIWYTFLKRLVSNPCEGSPFCKSYSSSLHRGGQRSWTWRESRVVPLIFERRFDIENSGYVEGFKDEGLWWICKNLRFSGKIYLERRKRLNGWMEEILKEEVFFFDEILRIFIYFEKSEI